MNGLVAFGHSGGFNSHFVWVDREGKPAGDLDITGEVGEPRISPDQTTIAFSRRINGNFDVWLYDSVRGGRPRPFASGPGTENHAIWSSDGSRLIYHSQQQPRSNHLVVERPVSLGPETILIKGPPGVGAASAIFPRQSSHNGHWLIVEANTQNVNGRIELLSREESAKRVPIAEGHSERNGSISPDGRWLVYSAQLASQTDIFVRPLPKEAGGPPN